MALLQKRTVILSILLTKATPYTQEYRQMCSHADETSTLALAVLSRCKYGRQARLTKGQHC